LQSSIRTGNAFTQSSYEKVLVSPEYLGNASAFAKFQPDDRANVMPPPRPRSNLDGPASSIERSKRRIMRVLEPRRIQYARNGMLIMDWLDVTLLNEKKPRKNIRNEAIAPRPERESIVNLPPHRS